jgi:hypothetical protein
MNFLLSMKASVLGGPTVGFGAGAIVGKEAEYIKYFDSADGSYLLGSGFNDAEKKLSRK